MPVPPDYVRKAAQRALDVRETLAPSNRAGTSVGLARARDLARGANVSNETINRMISYLSRTDKAYKEAKAKGRTIQDSKQILATYLWGGPRALAWAKSKKDD
jgi:hypothetical protein|tara:strand:+ start:797 stop:1105 length:309 start_codon:yes stop_codon:yes gene_type:complete